MSKAPWSDDENDAIVATYFAMLSDDLAKRTYVKAAYNRQGQALTGRPRGSVEFKFQNVSAVARALGLPFIEGYKPLSNFQMSLAEAVARWLARHPEWELGLTGAPAHAVQGAFEPAAMFMAPLEIEIAPTLSNAPPKEDEEMLEKVARRFDVAARDERNRQLGQAGEARVFAHEQAVLRHEGRDDLAQKVRWVSRDDGDGAGYDIRSYTPQGRPRLIEVKTTTGWARTPFYISRNELEVSEDNPDEWCLFRLHNFARHPKAFELRPPLRRHVSLIATSYQARFDR